MMTYNKFMHIGSSYSHIYRAEMSGVVCVRWLITYIPRPSASNLYLN